MPDHENIDTMTFEEAFADLETVINALEKEQQPLEEILAMYGRGQALARRCAGLLEQAEMSVRQLQNDGLLSEINSTNG